MGIENEFAAVVFIIPYFSPNATSQNKNGGWGLNYVLLERKAIASQLP